MGPRDLGIPISRRDSEKRRSIDTSGGPEFDEYEGTVNDQDAVPVYETMGKAVSTTRYGHWTPIPTFILEVPTSGVCWLSVDRARSRRFPRVLLAPAPELLVPCYLRCIKFSHNDLRHECQKESLNRCTRCAHLSKACEKSSTQTP